MQVNTADFPNESSKFFEIFSFQNTVDHVKEVNYTVKLQGKPFLR